jgi:hypothetical protein
MSRVPAERGERLIAETTAHFAVEWLVGVPKKSRGARVADMPSQVVAIIADLGTRVVGASCTCGRGASGSSLSWKRPLQSGKVDLDERVTLRMLVAEASGERPLVTDLNKLDFICTIRLFRAPLTGGSGSGVASANRRHASSPRPGCRRRWWLGKSSPRGQCR